MQEQFPPEDDYAADRLWEQACNHLHERRSVIDLSGGRVAQLYLCADTQGNALRFDIEQGAALQTQDAQKIARLLLRAARNGPCHTILRIGNPNPGQDRIGL